MKLLFLNQTFYPDSAATAQYLDDLARHCVEAGHEVTVLCGQQSYLAPEALHSAREEYAGMTIHRTRPLAFKRKGRLLRILHGLAQNFAFAWKLMFLPRQDRIIALTSPPLIVFVAAVVGRLKGSTVVHWAMDVNPEQVIRAGWLRRESLLARFLAWALRYSLRACRRIIAIDDDMGGLLIEKGAAKDKVAVLPLWCDTQHIRGVPREQNSFIANHGLGGKFVVLYSGNHSIVHPLTTLLESARELKAESEIQFVFIGGGDRKVEVQRFRESHKLENILSLPYQDRKLLSEPLSAADLHVVVMGGDFVGVLHPSKIYAALAAGRPVLFIGPRNSHIGRIVESYGIGWCVEHGDSVRCSSVISEAKQQPIDEKKRMMALSTEASRSFAREKLVGELAAVITS